jgi:cyclophilin family peptidyl-prolyl cis-trans isomerase
LFAADAPLTVNAFLRLADRGFFDGGTWHRVVPGFVAQDGDPRGDGFGGPGFALRDEVGRQRYGAWMVGLALDGPDTGSSQFFITLAPQPHLDAIYPLFGRVESGFDVISGVTQGDRIRRVRRR